MQTVAALCRELNTDRRPDGELLAAFISGPSEDAFVELIRRHGPLVWSACRRLLPNPADAEDAFQAAFLVLVRRARRLTHMTTLGPWLHRVAVWTARNVRRKNARQFAKQSAMPEFVSDPNAPDFDLKADLDAALLTLPARYRDSIILCHLQGFTRREAAERLGCAEGTLSSWLNRGLAKLRKRLGGLDPAKVLGIPALAVPAILVANTARAATATTVASATVPPAVSSLVEGVLHMFWVKKATAATVAIFAVFTLGVGVGVGTRTEYSAAVAGEGDGPKVPIPAAPADGGDQLKLKAEILQLQLELADTEKTLLLQKELAAAAAKRLQKANDLGNKAVADEARESLKKAELACAEAEKECDRLRDLIKATEAKLKEKEKQKPAATDVQKEIAELENSLRAAQVARNAAIEGTRVAKARLVEIEKANQAGKATPAEVVDAKLTLARFEEDVTTAKLKLELLKIKLEQLKAKAKAEEKEKPAKPELPKTLALDDFFGNPETLEDQLRRSEREQERSHALTLVATARLRVIEQNGTPEAIKAAKAEVEQARAVAEENAARSQYLRHRLAAAKAVKAPPLKAIGACIEVVVIGGGEPWPCRVREYGREGKFLGSVIAEDGKALELIMTRAMKDAGGPRDLWFTVSPDQAPTAIQQAADACKKAGYTKISINGALPQGIKVPLVEK